MDAEELVKSVNIVEYISQYVNLEQRGDEWWGLSCFKEEKTPSFSVRPKTGKFFDFSSGLGGSLVTFVKEYNGCSTKDALEIIKKYAGYDGELDKPRQKMAAVATCERYKQPKSTTKASKKTILSEDCMEQYEKRADKLAVWRKEGISDETLEKFQVYYDAFSNRLVYPIRNLSGQIVNIGGRTLDPEYKAKNLRKYTYFYQWGIMDIIYGLYENLDAIKRSKEVILFEGCKSVLMADTWGIHNTAAILTSHLNKSQMKILAKLGVRVVFALDKEVEIRNDRNISELKHYVPVGCLWDKDDLLSEKDSPVDKGEEVFRKLYGQRKRLK